jgi:hypothetical protein
VILGLPWALNTIASKPQDDKVRRIEGRALKDRAMIAIV